MNSSTVGPDEKLRNAMIAELAYYKAEARGFIPGYELDDWIEAESEVNTQWNDAVGPEDTDTSSGDATLLPE